KLKTSARGGPASGWQNSQPKAGPPLAEKLQLKSQILEAVRSFIGKQKQMPPAYSAKKIKGQKAYELARKGQKIELKEQEIQIYEIKLKAQNSKLPAKGWSASGGKTTTQNSKLENFKLTIDVHCSSGTYIRSLAHDIGQKLGCGAYVEELKRLAIGNFELSESIRLSKLTRDNWQKYLINFNTVMAAGTFEILHPGHQYFLKEAKKLGQKLFVVIARDKLAENLRGRRLRFNENERLDRVKKLEFVDRAMLGGARDLYQSIKKIKPDIIALGYDQKIDMSELESKIKKFGLKTKIARIGAYYPEKYKSSLLSSKYQ
ncbi:MAG: adenylyltransferase/cytidyltransferase family protein, partial [Patescibacteria group bacterium]